MTEATTAYMQLRGKALAWLYVEAVLSDWLRRHPKDFKVDRTDILALLVEAKTTERVASAQNILFTEEDSPSVLDLRRR